MKKNFLILVLLIITGSSVMYAKIKAAEATSMAKEVENARYEALAEKERADELASLAQQRAQEAVVKQAEVEALLRECQSK